MWHRIVAVFSNDNTAKVYSDEALVYDSTCIMFPGATFLGKFLYSDTNNNKRCFSSHMDDIRIFNTDALTLDNIGALSNSLYDDSRLKLRMKFQDATNTLGNYNRTGYGSCIDTTRFNDNLPRTVLSRVRSGRGTFNNATLVACAAFCFADKTSSLVMRAFKRA